MEQSDYWLEMQGRLTEPMRYDAASDHYVPVSWDDAFALIGSHLRALESPHQAEFYTSGRTRTRRRSSIRSSCANMARTIFPIARTWGCRTDQPWASPAIGVGKGTVILDDFDHAEAIFVMGQNPAPT